jgi:farnesyl-diphosphate farnesyltransferase
MSSPNIPIPNDDLENWLLQEVSRAFALTIPHLPAQLAKPVTNAYLVCRIADTIEDSSDISIEQTQRLFRELIGVLNGNGSAHRLAKGLHRMLSANTSPAERELVLNTPIVLQTFTSLNDCQQTEIRRCIQKNIFFHIATRGLPLRVGKAIASQPNPTRLSENLPGQSLNSTSLN